MSEREAWTLDEFKGRWTRLQAEMAKAGLDGIMVGESSNFLYLTGHESTQFLHRMRPQMMLLPREGKPTFFVYAAEVGKLKHLSAGAAMNSYVDIPFPVDDFATVIRSMGWEKATIGAELGPNQRLGLPVTEYQRLQKALPKLTWADAGPALMATQFIKSDGEIRVLKKACEISMQSWDLLLERIHPGVSEQEIIRQLSIANVELGADPNEPLSVHATHLSLGATDGIFREGDFLKCDFHSRYRGYWSDLCRIAVVGEPTAKHIEWHKIQAQLTADCIALVKPGIKVKEIATYSNKRLEAMGQTPLSPIKRIGHGIGLEATTPPSVNMLDETILLPGMTIAIEPRVVFDIGALLLEESVLVTQGGHELLTTGAGVLGVIR